MGNSNSSGITLEEFKDQVFGTTMLLLAPRLDNELNFVSDSTSELSESRLHTLPNVLQEHCGSVLDRCRTYYDSESRDDRQDLIDRYVNQVVLGSKKSANAYIALLVRQLNARHMETQDRLPHSRSASTSTLRVNVTTPVPNRPIQQPVSRTTMKLNRKIQQLNNEIAQQRQIYQAKANGSRDDDSDRVTVDDEYQQTSDTESSVEPVQVPALEAGQDPVMEEPAQEPVVEEPVQEPVVHEAPLVHEEQLSPVQEPVVHEAPLVHEEQLSPVQEPVVHEAPLVHEEQLSPVQEPVVHEAPLVHEEQLSPVHELVQ